MKPFEFLSPDDVPDELIGLYNLAKERKATAMAELRGDQPDLGQIHMQEFTAVERELQVQLSMGGVASEQTLIIEPATEHYPVAA